MTYSGNHSTLAATGLYAWVRHPQYTLLARAGGREVAARFGAAWRDYAARTPAFVPRGWHVSPVARGGGSVEHVAAAPPGRLR